MRYVFTLVNCYIAGVTAYLNTDTSTGALDYVLKAGHSSSHSVTGYHDSRKDVSRGQQKLVRRGRKTKKTKSQPPRGQPPQGQATSQQADQQQNKGNAEKLDQSPKKLPPPKALLKAEIDVRGPANIHTIRGNLVQEEIIPARERRHKIVSHTVVAGAGGASLGNLPANAASQSPSQHAFKTYAEGPVVETGFRISEGGRGHVSIDTPGRPHKSHDLHGLPINGQARPGEYLFTAESLLAEPAKMHASVTDGSVIDTVAWPRSRARNMI